MMLVYKQGSLKLHCSRIKHQQDPSSSSSSSFDRRSTTITTTSTSIASIIMFFFLNSLQAATLIAMNSFAAKLFITSTVRLYSIVYGNDPKMMAKSSTTWATHFSKAQLNEAEYAAFIMAPLLFLHFYHNASIDAATNQQLASSSSSSSSSWMATLATMGQVGYFWTRLTFGFPSVPAVAMAVVRYTGILLICQALYGIAF
jgi:hypothetical protein